jgi:hypothetical protein
MRALIVGLIFLSGACFAQVATVSKILISEYRTMPDENVVAAVHSPSNAQTHTEVAEPCPPRYTPEKVADRPHPITVLLGLVSPAIAVVALLVAFLSLWTSQRSMKVGQRAYLTYQVAVTNGNEVVEALRADKDFFLAYEITVTNRGNTPADLIYPKINVVPDPDRTPVMLTFPTLEAFDLGPKESRVLTGQALFKHVRNVRGLPGFTTGFTSQIEYKDVFRDSQVKQVCYQFLVSGDSASGGMCGTVMQKLQIK